MLSDEVFMCSAQFFAEFEIACRTAVPATSPCPKKGTTGRASDVVWLKKLAHLYGLRDTDPDLIYLSPYEFERWWDVQETTQVILETCIAKQFPSHSSTNLLAQHRIMVRRERPNMSAFDGCPMPSTRASSSERNARI